MAQKMFLTQAVTVLDLLGDEAPVHSLSKSVSFHSQTGASTGSITLLTMNEAGINFCILRTYTSQVVLHCTPGN